MVKKAYKERLTRLQYKQVDDSKTLYHYTNPEAYKKIIDTNSLLYKDIFHFKDNNEFNYTLQQLKDVYSKERLFLDKKFTNYFEKDFLISYEDILNPPEDYPIERKYYVACLCLTKNSEYMMEQYGESCIEFNTTLWNCFDPFNRLLFHAKVNYEEKLLQNNIENCLYLYNEKCKNSTLSPVVQSPNLLDDIKFLAVFNKKKDPFEQENEYRLLIPDTRIKDPDYEYLTEIKDNNENIVKRIEMINNTPYFRRNFYQSAISGMDAYKNSEYKNPFWLILNAQLVHWLKTFMRTENEVKF